MKLYKMLFMAVFAMMGLCAKAQTYKLEGNNLILPTPITFKSGTDNISENSETMIEYLKKYLESKTSVTLLRIEGHVADEKDKEKAQKLSEKRALAIAKALVKRGVDCKRLLPVGFGDNKPIEDNSSTVGKTKNTRIVISNAELRSKAIGGMPTNGGGKEAGSPCK